MLVGVGKVSASGRFRAHSTSSPYNGMVSKCHISINGMEKYEQKKEGVDKAR